MAAKIKKSLMGFRSADAFVLAIIAVLLVQAVFVVMVSGSKVALAFSAVFLVFVVGLYAVREELKAHGKTCNEVLFCFVLAFFGLVYMAVFAPGTVPDEGYHFLHAYALSNMFLGVPVADGEISMRVSDWDFYHDPGQYYHLSNGDRYSAIAGALTIFSPDSSIQTYDSVYTYGLTENPPQDRLAAALGITVARLLNLGSIPMFYLGRLFNLALYITLVMIAVKNTPIGKKVFMTVALLPITLHLGASYSYDGFIIGMAMVMTALCLNAINGEGKLALSSKIWIVVVIVLLAPCKLIYSLLAFLVLLVPKARFKDAKEAVVFKCIVIVAAVAAIALMRVNVLLEMMGIASSGSTLGSHIDDSIEEGMNVRGNEYGHFYTLSGILAHPFRSVYVFLNSFADKGDLYIMSLIGVDLGWFQFNGPVAILLMLFLTIALACVRSADDQDVPKLSSKLVFAAIALLGWAAAMLAMMLGWTFDTENAIEGMQGRYFLPFLPLAMLVFRSKIAYLKVDLSFWSPFSLAAINSAFMVWYISKVFIG